MQRILLGLCLVAVCLAVLPVAAEPASVEPAVILGPCGGEVTDLTDSSLAAELATRHFTSLGPPEVRYVSSTNSKVSEGFFAVIDEEGNEKVVAVQCTLTCSGTSCRQQGCEPSGNGCSSWDCGSGCVGSCTQKSEVVESN